MVATEEKRKLAEQYPMGSEAPDIDFVLQATMNLPNGGIHARFPGLPLPIVSGRSTATRRPTPSSTRS